ncbi:MAG: 50S ribosomal protein L10 [Candidatus Pacebacteria bacterium]|nr:50S ribosomal protein L10 [Candidatus Paceibacterota bacterium]
MKTKVQKKEELKSLQAKLPQSQITVFTSFARVGEKGLSVAQMTQLKRLLRESKSEYVVTKKTLVERAAKEMSKDAPINVYEMTGSLGLVVGMEEPYGLAKKIYDFSKKNPALKFFGAFVNGAFVSKEEFLEMAKMPSKEVLIGRLLGMMKYPITSLYVVMTEVAKKKGAGAPAPVDAPVVEAVSEAPAVEVPAEASAEAAPVETPTA